MFFKSIFIAILFIIAVYFTSDVKIQGSLYKAEDNVFSLQFPKAKWRKEPIFYIHCQSTDDGCRFNKKADDGNEKLEHFEGF